MRGRGTSRVRALLGRLVVGRRVVARPAGAAPPVATARRPAIALIAGLAIVAAGLTAATIGVIGGQRLLAAKDRELVRWESAYADLFAELRREVAAGQRALEGMRIELARARAAEREAGARFATFRATTRAYVDSLEREFAAMVEERDAALGLARSLRESVDEARGWLHVASDERIRFDEELTRAEARIAEVAAERDAARHETVVLAQHAERLEATVARLEDEQRATLARLRSWVVTHVEALENVFASTGVDPEDLIARAVDLEDGQGGPLRPVLPVTVEAAGGVVVLDAEIDEAFDRMLILQRLLAGLPLAAPLDRFRISSLFGERSDPFTRQPALHEGLDFVAARGAEVLATAPGEVVHAGWAGAYGNMVEIDHGLGINTRYAHLKEVAVAVGDEIEVRQPIGVIGTTGRSTGRHLHYEVRIDGEALDPANFLNAGARLVYAFE